MSRGKEIQRGCAWKLKRGPANRRHAGPVHSLPWVVFSFLGSGWPRTRFTISYQRLYRLSIFPISAPYIQVASPPFVDEQLVYRNLQPDPRQPPKRLKTFESYSRGHLKHSISSTSILGLDSTSAPFPAPGSARVIQPD